MTSNRWMWWVGRSVVLALGLTAAGVFFKQQYTAHNRALARDNYKNLAIQYIRRGAMFEPCVPACFAQHAGIKLLVPANSIQPLKWGGRTHVRRE